MELHLKTIGLLLILLAFIHIAFPKYFKWKTELNSVSLINRQMLYVHAFFIAFAVFLMGILCLTSATELTSTAFGKRISFGLGIFWTARFFVQFFGYSTTLWKGRKFETTMHVLFSILWVYFSTIFILTYLQ
jgi:hypothetical protein